MKGRKLGNIHHVIGNDQRAFLASALLLLRRRRESDLDAVASGDIAHNTIARIFAIMIGRVEIEKSVR
jgi:hypothetical protein